MLQFVLQFLNHLFDKEIAERNSAKAILTVRDRIQSCRVRLGGPVASGIFVAVLNQQRLNGYGQSFNERHFHEDQISVGKGRMKKREAATVRGEPTPQIVPPVDLMHRFISD